jgi:hypothetical protein
LPCDWAKFVSRVSNGWFSEPDTIRKNGGDVVPFAPHATRRPTATRSRTTARQRRTAQATLASFGIGTLAGV